MIENTTTVSGWESRLGFHTVSFLFDKPLSNLDAELRVTMRKMLAALHAKIGGTMIYVTHDQIEAMTLADKIAVLQDNRCMVGIRPEHIELQNTEASDETAIVSYPEQLSGETYLYCDVPGLPQITIHQTGQFPVQCERELPLAFERRDRHLSADDGCANANGVGT